MKRLLLAFVALPLMAHAATWTPVGSGVSSERSGKAFIDRSSVTKAEGGYKAWSLVSYPRGRQTEDGTPYRSLRQLHIFACGERSAILLDQVFYGQAMAGGPVVQTFKYEQFSPAAVAPGSAEALALEAVCRK